VTAPSICAVIIARNEERDLPKAIESLRGVADKIIVVDTGSTDRQMSATMAASINIGCKAEYYYYLDASEPVPNQASEYRIVNFAQARNHAIELGESTGCSHIMWLDADDRITTPLAFRRAPYLPEAVIGCWVELGGGIRQLHHRMWPTKYKVRFSGWVHEYPVIDKFPVIVLNDGCIVHDGSPHPGANEDSNQRNMRILTAEYAHEPNARTAFYLGNTHKDGGRWKEAAHWYTVRMGYGNAWRDEYLFAMLYCARCHIQLGDMVEAEMSIKRGIETAPDWQEFRMELAYLHYKKKDYVRAIEEATKAVDKPIPPSVLWREKDKYRDQPARLISWCHEHMGNLAQAFVWSNLATRLIGQYDADWAKREAVLEQRLNAPVPQAPAVVKGLRERIALHRPGAIGDILMTLNLLPAFKEAHPDADIHYYCHSSLARPEQLGGIIVAAGAAMVGNSEQFGELRRQYDRVIDLVGYPLSEGYPEQPMARHLLDYFAEEMDIGSTTGGLPSLTLRRPNLCIEKPYFTMQTQAGWSRYKQWPKERWDQVTAALAPLKFFLIDKSSGWELGESIRIFSNARMHIGIDSFCNHLTNYTWTDDHGGRKVPGVILWGSTQASAAGYPDNVNISKGLSCQPCFRENPAMSRMPRGPCVNVVTKTMEVRGAPMPGGLSGDEWTYGPAPSYDDPRPHLCMDMITVEEVVEAVRAMWAATGRN